MADCRACGATIDWAEIQGTEGSGGDGGEGRQRVPLERGSTETSGANRYAVVELGPPMMVTPMDPDSTRAAFVDHREDCPDYGDGALHQQRRYQ